jgi:hypothetical protein
MAIDNTHTKYLKGSDKKAWNDYGEALKAQQKLNNFFDGINVPELREGEEYDIPINKNKKPQK